MIAAPAHPHMRDDERAIIWRMIRAALSRGLLVSVYDGEEWTVKKSADAAAIFADCAQTDVTALRFRRASNLAAVGMVWLIHGNGEDVVSDWTHATGDDAASALMDELADIANGEREDVEPPQGWGEVVA